MWFQSPTAAICRKCPNQDFNPRKSYAQSLNECWRETFLLAPTAHATLSAKKRLTGTFIASRSSELDFEHPRSSCRAGESNGPVIGRARSGIRHHITAGLAQALSCCIPLHQRGEEIPVWTRCDQPDHPAHISSLPLRGTALE